MMTVLANHLWQSTLFAGVLALLAVALRRNSARVRYALWLTASLKFLVPFSLLVSLGQQLQEVPAAQQIATQIATPSISNTMVYITQPFPQEVSNVTLLPTPQLSDRDWLWKVLGSVWLAGFAAMVLGRLRAWSGIRRAVRASTPLDLDIPIPVRITPVLVEPGIFGIFRPLLLLPSGILQRLTTRQFQAVLAHELCHVNRRDNLTAIVQMLDEAIFWFYPLVWWIGAKLVEERERACDEEVLRLGNEPLVYAEGILTVCRNYQESPVVCVSGVTGSDLKKRIEHIMMNRGVQKLSFTRAALIVVVGAIVVTVPIAAGAVRSSTVAAVEVASVRARAAAPLQGKFAVTSIRQIPAGTPIQAQVLGVACNGADGIRQMVTAGKIGVDPLLVVPRGRCMAKGVTAQSVIAFAFGIPEANLSGGPSWVRMSGRIGLDPGTFTLREKESFLIEALADNPATATVEELRGMLQTMLLDRFGLKFHRETRQVQGYALVVAKDGPKIKEVSAPYESPRAIFEEFNGTLRRSIRGTSKLTELLDVLLPAAAGRLVDRTGLTGVYRYDFLAPLPPPPAPQPPARGGSPNGTPEGTGGFQPTSSPIPDLSAALEAQLGLRLQADSVPIEMLVIEAVEKPLEN